MFRSTCAILLIFAVAAEADVQTGVVRSGDQTIPGATITAECGNDPKITTTTDASGKFQLGGLPSTSCKYTVLMFGFEPQQKDAAASSTPLSFDLTLQQHATAPVAPKPVVTSAPTPAPSATTPAAPQQPPANTPDVPRPSLAQAQAAQNGRGGRGARGASGAAQNGRGRGATQQAQNGRGNNNQNQTSGFQSLNLVEDADAPPASDAPASLLAGGEAAAPASGDAFTVNGTLSQGVQSQPGDGFGGGPNGFGFGPGGPGGQFGGPGGEGLGAGGGRGGGPGGGGRGGGGFAGGGGRGGGGFGGGGGRGGGGFGGGRGGPGGRAGRGDPNGVRAFGNRAGRGRGPQWQLGLNYTLTNSALNARPYSLSSPTLNGQPLAKPATATNELRITLGGPIMIPKTPINLRNSRWNLSLTGSRNRQGVENIGSVPIAPFRTGDFSSLLTGDTPTVIYDPLTNQPFANNIIPQSRISSAALGLLKFYPSPTAIGLVKNYEFDASNPNNNNTVNGQLSIPITALDRVNINLSAQSRDSARIQTFGYRDPTSGGGKSLSVSYSRTLQPTLVNTFSVSVNRNTTNNLSYFSNGENIAGELGINGVLATPLTYGPPTLSFQGSSGLASLSDSTPSTNHSFTYSLTERIVKNIGKHTIQVGATGSKRQSNSLVANNARGNFQFSGVNTEQVVNGSPVSSLANPTGYDLADFLLGLPAQTSITNYLNGNDMFYYRQSSVAAYVNDDFRASTKFTVNGGLRWDLNLPQTEKYGHMANIEYSPDGTAAHLVTPGENYSFHDGEVPNGLIKPFYRMIEPQIGIAAKPWTKRPIVIRAGYGIRYDGGSIASLGSRLVTQPPFVQSVTLTPQQTLAQTGQVPTLENGFPTLPSGTLTNSFSVAPDFQPAMSQQWNAIVQYSIGRSYVVQGSYFGNKGSHLLIVEGPNRATPGDARSLNSRIPIQNLLSTITLEDSIGHSTFNSGQLQVTRRFARGIGASVTYALQKGISDSTTFGSSIVEIQGNLAAERAVMPMPHQDLSVRFNYQSLAGNQKSQFIYKVLRGWQLSGTYDVNSGTPFTATVGGDPSGTGLTGSTRANATGLPVDDGSGYFNTAAFALVPAGTFGTAGRNTIPGIVNFSINASAMRTFRFGERHRLAFTFSTSNPLNHVSITGIGTQVGNYTYGLATRAADMRTVRASARFTF
ncbi:MAG TPA: carboxypeptidase regulatory-like domain-containing protein [Bryobacteraceae bacterium]|nr:carboxypeptidase regulatory-like domain-containing protein [Bryobacteraceae bacterium]